MIIYITNVAIDRHKDNIPKEQQSNKHKKNGLTPED